MGLIGDNEQALRRTGPDNWAWYGSFINFMTTAWPRESSLDSAKECAVLQLFCVCVCVCTLSTRLYTRLGNQ